MVMMERRAAKVWEHQCMRLACFEISKLNSQSLSSWSFSGRGCWYRKRAWCRRSLISPAAFLVKVTQRMDCGFSTVSKRQRKRVMSNCVLPDPAGALIIKEALVSRALRRAC